MRTDLLPIYIHLFHGRSDPYENLEDWGTEGPIFGPFECIQSTYACDIHLRNSDDTEYRGLRYYDDMVYYDGVYYGDYNTFSPVLEPITTPFDPDKARLPGGA
jgi:hypothetical protein